MSSVAEDVEVVAGIEQQQWCMRGVGEEFPVGSAEEPIQRVRGPWVGGEGYQQVRLQAFEGLQVW